MAPISWISYTHSPPLKNECTVAGMGDLFLAGAKPGRGFEEAHGRF